MEKAKKHDNYRIMIAMFAIAILVSTITLLFMNFLVLYPLEYKNEIMFEAKEYGLAPELIASMINCESGFDSGVVSRAGALGLMQLMPTTASWIASRTQKLASLEIDLFNPETNIAIGVAYVAYLAQKFPDTFTMLCAYNAGEGLVRQWQKNPQYCADGSALLTTPFAETNKYAKKVLFNIKQYRKRF